MNINQINFFSKENNVSPIKVSDYLLKEYLTPIETTCSLLNLKSKKCYLVKNDTTKQQYLSLLAVISQSVDVFRDYIKFLIFPNLSFKDILQLQIIMNQMFDSNIPKYESLALQIKNLIDKHIDIFYKECGFVSNNIESNIAIIEYLKNMGSLNNISIFVHPAFIKNSKYDLPNIDVNYMENIINNINKGNKLLG